MTGSTPAALIRKFEDGRDFDWEDLRQLTNKARDIDKDGITQACVRGFAYLTQLTPEEAVLAADPYQRQKALCQELKDSILDLR